MEEEKIYFTFTKQRYTEEETLSRGRSVHVVQVQEKEDWPEHRTIISLLLEAFGLTNHTVEDVLWAVGKSRRGNPVLKVLQCTGG
jgi:hypothetical protein